MTIFSQIYVDRELLLGMLYLAPVIATGIVLLVNYCFGAAAMQVMAKRYQMKNGALCWIPFVRYWFIGKLAYSGKFNLNKREWLCVVFPVVHGISVLFGFVERLILCLFAYSVTEDIMVYFERATRDPAFDWQSEFAATFTPQWMVVADYVALVFSVVSIVLGVMLFLDFYKRFKSNSPVWFTILSVILGLDGLFVFACRNNFSVEEMMENGNRFRWNPFGNPYGGSYGNPYGGNGSYGQSSDPFGEQKGPYGQSSPDPFGERNGSYGQSSPDPFGTDPEPPQSGKDGNDGGENGNGGSPFGD